MLDSILQAGIDHGYGEFVARVAQARHMTPARVNDIGQGRVWDGGTAHQIGLVDRFGDIQAAIDEAARRAKLDPKDIHPVYLEKEPGWLAQFAKSYARRDDDDDDAAAHTDIFARIGADRRQQLAKALGDIRRMASGGSVQARCLECAGLGPVAGDASDTKLLDLVLTKVGF